MTDKNKTVLYAACTDYLRSTDAYRAAYESVSPERRQKTDRYRRESDRRLSLGAGVLLAYALREFGYADEPVFRTGEHGKPYIEGGPEFSVSHSGEYVLCAVSDVPVGCDVELVAEQPRGVAKRFFTADEFAECTCAEDFFRIWTRKESFIKATGLGMSLPLTSFSTFGGTVTRDGVDWFIKNYALSGYACALCTRGDCLPAELCIAGEAELTEAII